MLLEVLQAETLQRPGIRHGFFTNRGGVSEGIYTSLNTGLGTRDEDSNVKENRRRARFHFSSERPPLCTLYQCHSNHVVEVTNAWPDEARQEADAMVTAAPGIIIGILTADCVPVLLADARAGIVAAAHAGWKGAMEGIIRNTIGSMEQMGADRSSITAAIGPAIQTASYEVGPELRLAFIDRFGDSDSFFIAGRKDRFQFDLVGFVAERLRNEGIQRLDVIQIDTYKEQDRFFSYRRATHRKEEDYGRQLSAICLTRKIL